jgi:hypothetical protein
MDVSTLISLLSSPFLKLQEFGAQMLSEISDPNIASFENVELQFENHIKFILEMSLNKKRGIDFKNYCLLTIANLCLRDSLRAQIVYNKGLEVLFFHLRNVENEEGMRIAAKGLLNLSLKSSNFEKKLFKKHQFLGDLKLKIVTELSNEIRLMQRNQLDEVVSGYLQTLLQSRESRNS